MFEVLLFRVAVNGMTVAGNAILRGVRSPMGQHALINQHFASPYWTIELHAGLFIQQSHEVAEKVLEAPDPMIRYHNNNVWVVLPLFSDLIFLVDQSFECFFIDEALFHPFKTLRIVLVVPLSRVQVLETAIDDPLKVVLI